ncbi:MAG: 2-oxoacid:ferredoxin oxidoreductase subunit gamma [Ruminococcaceae bacterium]|nr:2-oxoacid:ferredoxin oxidoreductase subunit gamma [Oscillospiraceae bacterium]
MMTSILLAGFGGQGILFAGKQIAHAAMEQDKFVTWLPSYGPEMRGGTANCSVIVADEEIGSPLVAKPDIFIAMNIPSHDKFKNAVVPGGMIITDSSLISEPSERTDIKKIEIPATRLADENGLKGMANVIILGKLIKETGLFDYDFFLDAMISSIPASKAKLIDFNKKALEIGYNN